MCNNSPAEWISPENGWRFSDLLILCHLEFVYYFRMSRRAWRLCVEAFGVNLRGTASSADLGGSSKYTREILVD